MTQQISRILFITNTNIGDVVISTCLLRRILASHPQAKVDVAGGKAGIELLRHLPAVDQILPMVKQRGKGHYFKLYQQTREQAYDLVVDLRTPLLGRLIQSRQTIMFKPNKQQHRATQLAQLWPADEPIKPLLAVSDELRQRVQDEARNHKDIAVIAPTANWPGKQWPQANFAQLLWDLLAEPLFSKTQFVLTGAAHEMDLVSDLLAVFQKEPRVTIKFEQSLSEVAAWCEHASLFIGHDSGLAHIAAAVETPSVVLFGPMADNIYRPVGAPTQVIVPPTRSWHNVNLTPNYLPRVITDISPATVLAKVRQFRQDTAS